MQKIKDHKIEVSNSKGINFLHVDIYSLPPKINKKLTETKLDKTVYNSEVAVDGCNIL